MDEQSHTHSGEPLADEMTGMPAKELLVIHTFDQWVAELFVIFSITNQLLKEYYEREENKTGIPEFPIPAEKIAAFCGYEIIPEDLNRYRNKQIGLTLGKINTDDRTISIDNGIGVSYAQNAMQSHMS